MPSRRSWKPVDRGEGVGIVAVHAYTWVGADRSAFGRSGPLGNRKVRRGVGGEHEGGAIGRQRWSCLAALVHRVERQLGRQTGHHDRAAGIVDRHRQVDDIDRRCCVARFVVGARDRVERSDVRDDGTGAGHGCGLGRIDVVARLRLALGVDSGGHDRPITQLAAALGESRAVDVPTRTLVVVAEEVVRDLGGDGHGAAVGTDDRVDAVADAGAREAATSFLSELPVRRSLNHTLLVRSGLAASLLIPGALVKTTNWPLPDTDGPVATAGATRVTGLPVGAATGRASCTGSAATR